MLWNGWDNSHLIKIWYFSKYPSISLTLWHQADCGPTEHQKLDPGTLTVTSHHLSLVRQSSNIYTFLFLHIYYPSWCQLNCHGVRHKPGTVSLYVCMMWRSQQASKPVSVRLAPNTRDNISYDMLELLNNQTLPASRLGTSTDREEMMEFHVIEIYFNFQQLTM